MSTASSYPVDFKLPLSNKKLNIMANKRPIMRWIEIIFLHFKLSVTVKEEYKQL